MDIDLYIYKQRGFSKPCDLYWLYICKDKWIYIYITIKIPPRLQCAILRSLQQGLRGLLTQGIQALALVWDEEATILDGDVMGFYGDLMVIYDDLMGCNRIKHQYMELYSDLMVI